MWFTPRVKIGMIYLLPRCTYVIIIIKFVIPLVRIYNKSIRLNQYTIVGINVSGKVIDAIVIVFVY